MEVRGIFSETSVRSRHEVCSVGVFRQHLHAQKKRQLEEFAKIDRSLAAELDVKRSCAPEAYS